MNLFCLGAGVLSRAVECECQGIRAAAMPSLEIPTSASCTLDKGHGRAHAGRRAHVQRLILGVSETGSAKTGSAIDVRIDDQGSILKFLIGLSL